MQESLKQSFRWPAEWEPHRRTWIAWPTRPDDWPGRFEPIPWVYAEIVRHLHLSEPVVIVVPTSDAISSVTNILTRCGVDMQRIQFVAVPTDRGWLRDSGPIFVADTTGGTVALDWQFNAWAKYSDFRDDNALPSRLAERFGWQLLQPQHRGNRVVLEGGSIDGNGQGLLLTTEECLLSNQQERNPGFTRADYERVFCEYLGVKKVLWLGRGIVGDDTHGHVDDIARFVSPRTVVVAYEENLNDPNYEPLHENWERLCHMTDLNNRSLEVVKLPMPDPVIFDGQRLPASYANFYIANRRVLVPTFNAPQDRQALELIARLFPDRTVVGIHAVELVWGLGTLHCLTQQEPAFS
jgi:agmatine deiminase